MLHTFSGPFASMEYDRRHLADAEIEVLHRQSIVLMDLVRRRPHRSRSLDTLQERHAEIIQEMKRRRMI